MDKQLSIWASNYINTFTSKIISNECNFNIKFNIQFIITNNKVNEAKIITKPCVKSKIQHNSGKIFAKN